MPTFSLFSSAAALFAGIYDRLNSYKYRQYLEQIAVYLSAWGFLLHLLLIFLARTIPTWGTGVLAGLDLNYLHAVYTPFTFILLYEVLLLVLALPQSHTSSIGKQYEIISLITVRGVFKDIGEFRSLENWWSQVDAARAVMLDMVGAVVMFLLVTLFYYVRKHVAKSATTRDLEGFIALKKLVAVLLSGLLVTLAGYNLFVWIAGSVPWANQPPMTAHDLDVFFFPAFFEFMIFTDVLLLIVSIAYYDRYQYVFRNAGFVISTVLLRFSLSTEKPYDVVLAVIAMLYGLSVLGVFCFFTRIFAADRTDSARPDKPPQALKAHPEEAAESTDLAEFEARDRQGSSGGQFDSAFNRAADSGGESGAM